MELSRMRRLAYSLWMVLLFPPALIALGMVLTYRPTHYFSATAEVLVVVNLLIPLAYLLGWLTSRSREERLSFLVALCVRAAIVTLFMLLHNRRGLAYSQRNQAALALCALMCAETVAACAFALLRRRQVVVRAALWRAPEQVGRRTAARAQRRTERAEAREERRDARVRREEALVAEERRKMDERPVMRPARRRRQDSAGRRSLEAEPAVVPEPAPGDALASVLGVAAEAPAAASAPVADGPQQPARPQQPVRPQTVDANTCTATDLFVLPGMSVALARRVVEEREAHGPYGSLQQLVARTGLRPHEIAAFAGHLDFGLTDDQPSGGHRARTLDL